jgi:ADP-heptose:LPS heptosyltransferase
MVDQVTPPPEPGEERLLVLMLAGIGDLLLASPALRRLERHFGADRLRLAVVPRTMGLLPLLDLECQVVSLPLDRVRLPAPLWKGTARRQLALFLEEVRGAGITRVISLHEIGSPRGLLSMYLLLRGIGVGDTLGRGYRSTTLPFQTALPEATLAGLHNVIRYHRVADLAGAPGEHDAPLLTSPALPDGLPGLPEPLLCLNPGADRDEKRWPPEHLIVAGRRLKERFAGLAVLGGPGEAAESTRIAEAIGPPAVSLAGRVDLTGLAAVLGRAEVLVTNNSGPMHLAAALGTRVVAIFGNLPTDTLHPYLPAERYRVLSRADTRRSSARRRQLAASVRAVTTDAVIAAVGELTGI